jgi:ABC-type multidrug transport system fused ATPase/permease subunit
VIFQVSAFVIGLVLTLAHLSSIALIITFISLVLLLGVLSWFYIRYRSYSIVQEKRKLYQLNNNLQAQILAHTTNIQLTHQNREKLEHAEQDERAIALRNLQKKHIESGMINSRIADADIPGIGPGLKQRLAAHGFSTAANIGENVTYVEGFGPAKTQAILDWKNKTYNHFNATKPTDLPPERDNEIKDKYKILHANNDAERQNLEENKNKLENARKEIQPRITQLLPFTYLSFLRHGLASQGIIAGILGFVIISSQLLLGTSATLGTIKESIPTATMTPTITLTPTATFTETLTLTPTITDTPTISDTPTITYTPTTTFTPTKTFTPTITPTCTPTRTSTWLPGVYTAIPLQPTQGYCCKICGSNSQPCGDSCISLKYTCHKPPGCACK